MKPTKTVVAVVSACVVAATVLLSGTGYADDQRSSGYGMMGGGPGYGRMGQGYGPVYGMGYGMGPGMMGYGMGWGGGPGYGMGPGMMMGPGYGMGYGMGPGMMGYGMGWGGGPGYGMGPCGQLGAQLDQPLTVDDVRNFLQQRLDWMGNDRLKVGKVTQTNDKTITGEIVTKDNSLVEKYAFDRTTGYRRPVR